MKIETDEIRIEKTQKRMLPRKIFSLIINVVLIVLLVILIVMLMVMAFNRSFGWFASYDSVNAEQMNVSVHHNYFELEVSGDQAFPYAADSPIAAYLSANAGIEKASATDIESGRISILCNFLNENPHEEGVAEIAPGSFGTISFDIIVPSSHTGNFDISFDTLAYGISGTEPQEVAAADKDILYPLISGHILLFRGRSTRASGGYYFTDRITNGGFVYDVSDPAHTPVIRDDYKHYTVNIYWIWPATFSQFALAEDNPKLHMNSVFHSDSDRLDMLDYVIDNQNEFFRNLVPIVDFTMTGFEDTYFVELSDAYNQADQFIGDKAHFLVLRATVTMM